MMLLMDACNTKSPPSTARQKGAASTEEVVIRPLLVLSEKNNAAALSIAHRPRTREVAPSYKPGVTASAHPFPTHGSPKSCHSPTAPRMDNALRPSSPKRTQSAERRRPSVPLSRSSAPSSPRSRPSTPLSSPSRPSTPVRDSTVDIHSHSRRRTVDGLWPSMRSLTSSFQSECISIPISKKDRPATSSSISQDHSLKSLANTPSERKHTPVRRSSPDQSENTKHVENSHPRGVDQHLWPSVTGGTLSASSRMKSVDLTTRGSRASLPMLVRGVSPTRKKPVGDGHGVVVQKSTSNGTMRGQYDGIGREEDGTASNFSGNSSPSERAALPTHPIRTQSLPVPGAARPSSPNKAYMSTTVFSKGMASPSRTRPSTPFFPSTPTTVRTGISSSALSYIIDIRKGKKNACNVEDAHQLRLLHNRQLQWHFVNSRAESAMSIQKMTADTALYNVCVTIGELLDSITMKKICIQQLNQALKLDFILNEQIAYLEEWASLEREHSTSLSGAIEALKGSIIRIPVTGRARADIRTMKKAISSAVDIVQAMGSSMFYWSPKAQGANLLASELSNVVVKELAMLDECRELLASTSTLQVHESCLRTHILQLQEDMLKVGNVRFIRF